MGKQTGPIFITGTFQDLSFYQMNGRHYVRRKGGPSRKQVLRSPRFGNSRRVISEFSKCSRDAGLLRRSIRCLFGNELTYHRRMNKLMLAIKNYDRTSPWGERCLQNALKSDEAKSALMQFDFVEGRRLNQSLLNRISIAGDKTFKISGFNPRLICFPKEADVVLISLGWSSIDFLKVKSKFTPYESILIDRQTNLKEIVLRPLKKMVSLDHDFYILRLQFFTKVGKQYLPCKNSKREVLTIVAIDPQFNSGGGKKFKASDLKTVLQANGSVESAETKLVTIPIGVPARISIPAPT